MANTVLDFTEHTSVEDEDKHVAKNKFAGKETAR